MKFVGSSIRSRMLIPLGLLGSALAIAIVLAVLLASFRMGMRQLDRRAALIAGIVRTESEALSGCCELQRVATALGVVPDVELVLVVASSPVRVVASSNPTWVGRPLDSIPEASGLRDPILRTLSTRTELRFLDGVRDVHVRTGPIEFKAAKRAGTGPTEGAMLLHLGRNAAIGDSLDIAAWIGGALFLALGILIGGAYLLVSRHVVAPVSRLVGLFRGEDRTPPPDSLPQEILALEEAWSSAVASSRRTLRALENQKLALDHHGIVSETDPKGVIRYVNDKFCSLSGFEREELLGKTHRMVNSGVHPPEFFGEMWKTILSGEVWRGNVCNRAKAGHLYWVSATIVPMMGLDGKPERFIAIRTDITDQVEKETRLEALNRDLEAQTLRANELAEKANSANIAKGEFLANMSHEIRTPMNGVIGMAELLLQEDLTPRQRERANLVLESARSLLSLINDILDFSKIEAGKLDLVEEPFDMHAQLSNVREFFSGRVAEKRLGFHIRVGSGIPSRLSGDPGRLRQILVNLVGNALKFTEKGSIILSVEVAEQNDKWCLLRFRIKDTGIGIPPERLHSLFQSFTQVDASITRRFGGTGLGLAISKRLAQLMEGSIGVESTEGEGSEFWFTARFGQIGSESLQTSHDSSHNGEPPPSFDAVRILVVDDNVVNQMVCSGILEHLGMDVETAGNGLEALAVLEVRRFDLVLMDMQMPVMDGLEAARSIRAPDSKVLDHDVPIVALTANAMARDADACLDAGMDGFIPKPIMPSALEDAIRKHLRKPGRRNGNGA